MIFYFLRGSFVLLAASVTMLYVLGSQEDIEASLDKVLLILGVTLGMAGLIITVDVLTPRKRLSALSGVILGLIAGLLTAYACSLVIDLIGLLTAPVITFPVPQSPEDFARLTEDQLATLNRRDGYLNLLEGAKVLVGIISCYFWISLVLQTKDDFRFVIPYVEFAKEVRGQRPTIVDTSVLIDGRIQDIVECKVMQGTLMVHRSVLSELHAIADSSDKLKRARGRRGLDVLAKLQASRGVEVHISHRELEGESVDAKLLDLARQTKARLMTHDFNLAKIAQVRGIDVINLNDLAKALRPVVLPGEAMRVQIIKAGEASGQGVGYLDDGTMVVVENARQHIGNEIDLTVTSALQTSAGRMIFGRFETTQDTDPAPVVPDSTEPAPRRAPTGRNPRRG